MAENVLTESTDAALVNGLADSKRELFNLRFQLATGQLENTSRISEVKKEIARVNTEIRSREIAAADAATSDMSAVAAGFVEGES